LALAGSYFAVVLWFLLGVFVDADHEVDFFMREKKITFNVNEILNPPPYVTVSVFIGVDMCSWILGIYTLVCMPMLYAYQVLVF